MVQRFTGHFWAALWAYIDSLQYLIIYNTEIMILKKKGIIYNAHFMPYFLN